MRITSILGILAWALVSAAKYIPRVTRSVLESSKDPEDSWFAYFSRFTDSDTVISILDGVLHISFNNGEVWKTVDIDAHGGLIHVDPFHKDRGFVLSSGRKLYVTDDQGRTWRECLLPDEVGFDDIGCYRIDTHPFNRNLLLIRCETLDEDSGRLIAYASDDTGESFRRILAPVSDYEINPQRRYVDVSCEFIATSKETLLQSADIYCLHNVDWDSEVAPTLFYTTDLGKTTRLFDELKGFWVEEIDILPSSVVIITSDVHNPRLRDKLWISTGGTFNAVPLSERVTFQIGNKITPEDNQGLLLTVVTVHDDANRRRSVRVLVVDPSNLDFFFSDPAPLLSYNGLRLNVLDTPGSTLLSEITLYIIFEGKFNKLRVMIDRLKNIFSRRTRQKIAMQRFSMTKVSLDSGKTWGNLKVVDPSGKHRHLFKCDIDDLEHCSFQIQYSFNPRKGDESTAEKMMIQVGTVRENYNVVEYFYRKDVPGARGVLMSEVPRKRNTDEMTFISRDRGASWEVALEFPVYARVLDFGNIIIAIAMTEEENKTCNEFCSSYSGFYFSLDQGKNWEEYHFSDPIDASEMVVFDGGFSKAVIVFERSRKTSTEYILYSIDFSEVLKESVCIANDWKTWYSFRG